jgi:hypothetical protein
MEEDFDQVLESIEAGHFFLIAGKRIWNIGKGMESRLSARPKFRECTLVPSQRPWRSFR